MIWIFRVNLEYHYDIDVNSKDKNILKLTFKMKIKKIIMILTSREKTKKNYNTDVKGTDKKIIMILMQRENLNIIKILMSRENLDYHY